MSWYVLLVACSAVVMLSVATGAFLRGWIDGDSTEGTRPTQGGIVLLAYVLGRATRLRREHRTRLAITPKGRR